MRETDCEIEAEGVRRAEAHGKEAHVAIYLIDASQPLHEEDRIRLEKLDPKRSIIVLNKLDKGSQVLPSMFKGLSCVGTRLISEQGITELKEAMAETLEQGANLQTPPHAVISERHRNLLIVSHKEAQQARTLLNKEVEENAVFAVEHLRTALESLGQVTGRVYHEELLNNIFSRFCIGK